MTERAFPVFGVCFALLLAAAFPWRVQAESTARLGGTVKFFTSVYTQGEEGAGLFDHEAGDSALTRVELRARLDGSVSENVSFRSRVDFIHTADARFEAFGDLESGNGFSSQVHDVDLYFKEGSFKMENLFVSGLDLTAGRQRVRWGTSDEWNVVDNLNPVDYANLFSFDPDYFVDHIPMDGLAIEYRFPVDFDLKIQAVWFPAFKPSPLPEGFESYLLLAQQATLDALTASLGLPMGTTRAVLSNVPGYRLGAGVLGLRVSGNLANFDLGVSYFHGHHTLPLPEKVQVGLVEGLPSLEVRYGYPRVDVFGFDLAGEIWTVGLWAELGVYLSEDFDTELCATVPPDLPPVKVPLLKRPYTKFTVGFDYTFGLGDGLYWNTQYNHGFYDEFAYTREARNLVGTGNTPFLGELEDYYISYLEYAFFNDTLKVTLNGLLEVADYGDFRNRHAWMFNPEFELVPFDGASLLAGYAMIAGAEDSKFGLFSGSDVLYLLLKAFF